MLLNSNSRITYRIILAVMTTLLSGCTGDPDATFVDFSDRMVVERPGDGSQDNSYFKVAVGSIISAQETVVHYHEILEYMAGKLGQQIQLVQRKTYGEINELIGVGKISLANRQT